MAQAKRVKSYIGQMNDCIAWYARFPVESLKICISAGNSKIGHAWNLSIPPIFTCGNCSMCENACYDIKANLQYENVRKARARNYSILRRNYNLYWEQIRDRMKRIEKRSKYKFFRFHVGGELPSEKYFSDMVESAWMCPGMESIWTYTKMHAFVNRYIANNGGSIEKAFPENFHPMLSVWYDEKIHNPYNCPVFVCVPVGGTPPEGMYQCPGNCDVCKASGRGCVHGESAWTYEH